MGKKDENPFSRQKQNTKHRIKEIMYIALLKEKRYRSSHTGSKPYIYTYIICKYQDTDTKINNNSDVFSFASKEIGPFVKEFIYYFHNKTIARIIAKRVAKNSTFANKEVTVKIERCSSL